MEYRKKQIVVNCNFESGNATIRRKYEMEAIPRLSSLFYFLSYSCFSLLIFFPCLYFMPFHFHFSLPHSIFILPLALITSVPPKFLPISRTFPLSLPHTYISHIMQSLTYFIYFSSQGSNNSKSIPRSFPSGQKKGNFMGSRTYITLHIESISLFEIKMGLTLV
jgi:hypothetical protein